VSWKNGFVLPWIARVKIISLFPKMSPDYALDYLTWEGTGNTIFTKPEGSNLKSIGPQLWRMAWVNAVDQWETWWSEPFRLSQNEGRGLISTGTRDWQDYRITAAIRPAMIKAGGLAARVQGLQRFYALQLTQDKKIRLVRVYEGMETILAEAHCAWQFWQGYKMSLEMKKAIDTASEQNQVE
jgi:hypothetical protein